MTEKDEKEQEEKTREDEAGTNEVAESEDQAAETTQSSDTAQKESSKIRRITHILLWICLVFFIWYLVADRLTPSTNQARVRAFVVPIGSQVQGNIIKINVATDEFVAKDRVLFEIDPEAYQIALREAEVALEDAMQQVGGDEKTIAAAEAALAEAKVRYNFALKDARRARQIADTGAIAERDVDKAYGKAEKEKASIAKAEANLEEAKNRFGQEGSQNTKFKKALADLDQARLNLSWTSIKAPHDGVVSNMKVEVGHYAKVGNRLASFISTKDVWIEAYLRENNLGNIKKGNEVEIALDSAPGRVFKGVVESVYYGVKWNQNEQVGDLSVIASTSGWLRDPQRYPVVIKFADNASVGLRREGGQADIIVYTGDSVLMNTLGRLWIRVITYLSYIY